MHPVLIRIPLPGGGHFDIATYGVMMALGTLFGVFAAWRLARRDGIRGEMIVDVGFWGVMGGILGAKIWYIVQYWSTYQNKWDLVYNFRSGLVWYGGVLGGTVCILAFVRWKRLGSLKVLDICAPAGVLGLAFGRIGCFFNGCCYGRLTDSAVGVCFKRVTDNGEITGSPAFVDQLYRGLVTASDTVSRPMIPTQLFESAGALVIFAILVVLRRWRRFYGEQLAALFVLYPALRFTMEFFRGDHEPWILSLTAAQVFSVLTFVAAVGGLVWLRATKPVRLAVGGAALAPEQTGC